MRSGGKTCEEDGEGSTDHLIELSCKFMELLPRILGCLRLQPLFTSSPEKYPSD
jgi:hypothetical protein